MITGEAFGLTNILDQLPAARHLAACPAGDAAQNSRKKRRFNGARGGAVERNGHAPEGTGRLSKASGAGLAARGGSHRRKKITALLIATLVVLSIPALILALILLG